LPVGRLIPFMFAPLLCDSNHLTGSPRIKSQDQFAALIGRETVGREVAVFFPPPPGFLFSNWRHHENDLLWAAESEDLSRLPSQPLATLEVPQDHDNSLRLVQQLLDGLLPALITDPEAGRPERRDGFAGSADGD